MRIRSTFAGAVEAIKAAPELNRYPDGAITS